MKYKEPEQGNWEGEIKTEQDWRGTGKELEVELEGNWIKIGDGNWSWIGGEQNWR